MQAAHKCPQGCMHCKVLDDQAQAQIQEEEERLEWCQELEEAFEELVQTEQEIMEWMKHLHLQAQEEYHQDLPS
jgi:hypothetical protein